MSSHQHRPSSETLPAIRSTSPLPLLKSSTKNMNETISLPGIQSLTREFPSRLDHHPGTAHSFQRDSPPEQHASQYQRKRAGIPGDASPPGTNKRRRVDSEEPNGSYNDQISHPLASSTIPESNIRKLAKQQPLLQESHDDPSTPTQQSLSSRTHVTSHELVSSTLAHGGGHSRHTSSASNLAVHGPSHEQAPTKQEQITPPSVVVQSPATPSTGVTANPSATAWQNEPSASFSRRISNPSSHRPTPRKQPPSRLNFQTHSSQRASLESIAPSIRSAPPVPAPGQLASNQHPPLAANSTWLTNRPTAQSRPRHTSHLSSSDLPTPRALARDAWPAIPTPTSLRLSARATIPPTAAANQGPGAAAVSSPSARLPITPAVPSPIPTLGSGTGLADKAKFMQKMSDIYDRATSNSHKNCVTSEELDRRLREAVMLRDHEILQLKKAVVEMQKRLAERGSSHELGPTGAVDEDGDVNMGSTGHPIRTSLPAASNNERSTTRASPIPIESTKEGSTANPRPSEEVGTSSPSPAVVPNGITRHSPAA